MVFRVFLLTLVSTAALAGTAWDFSVCATREENWFGEREGERQHWIETTTSCRTGTARVDGARIAVAWDCCGATPQAPKPENYAAVSTDGGRTFTHLDDESQTWWTDRVAGCPSDLWMFGLLGGSVRVRSVTFSPAPVPGATTPYSADVELETSTKFVIPFRDTVEWTVRVDRTATPLPGATGVIRLLDDDALFRCTDLIVGNPRRVVAESESEAPRAERPLVTRIVIELANARPWQPEASTFEVPEEWREVEEPDEP